MSLTWSEMKRSMARQGITLTAKSGNAIILTVDIEISDGTYKPYGPLGTIHGCRIRSIWNSKEDIYYDYKTKNPIAVTKSGHFMNTIQDVRDHCETRWQEWKNKAGLVAIEEAQ
jgi:hypothetical protein